MLIGAVVSDATAYWVHRPLDTRVLPCMNEECAATRARVCTLTGTPSRTIRDTDAVPLPIYSGKGGWADNYKGATAQTLFRIVITTPRRRCPSGCAAACVAVGPRARLSHLIVRIRGLWRGKRCHTGIVTTSAERGLVSHRSHRASKRKHEHLHRSMMRLESPECEQKG